MRSIATWRYTILPQVRWNRTWRYTRRLESTKKWPTGSKPRREGRDESRASIDEQNLDAKIETERPLYTQGRCSDSACGRQHKGVVSLVPADPAPGTAVNRQVETVQDDHTRHLDKRSSDDCRKGTTVPRQHADASKNGFMFEKSVSKPWKQGLTHVSGARWGAASVSQQTPRSARHQRRSMKQEYVGQY